MLNRLTPLLLLLLAIPTFSQHSSTPLQRQIDQTVEQRQQQISRVPTSPELDTKAARIQAIRQDANDLSALSASLQSDLQKLQYGILVKDLHDNLKKMEKLSKKLRQEME